MSDEDLMAWIRAAALDLGGAQHVIAGLDEEEARDAVGRLVGWLALLSVVQSAMMRDLTDRFRDNPAMNDDERLTVLQDWLNALPVGLPGLQALLRRVAEDGPG